MKKPLILICLASMLLITDTIKAQVEKKSHSIGVQLNPYMDSFFFEGTFIKPVFALRYGYNLNNHLSFGPEFSGYFVHWNSDQSDLDISNINIGALQGIHSCRNPGSGHFLRSARIINFITLSQGHIKPGKEPILLTILLPAISVPG